MLFGRDKTDHQTWFRLPAFQLPFAKDRADARIDVLQIGRGVAVKRQHLVPAKTVVRSAVLHEVGIFDRANANHPSDARLLVLRQTRMLVTHDGAGALLGFIQQGFELDRLPLTGLDRSAVLAQDRAEPHVLQGQGIAPAPGCSKQLAEVELLATISHIDDAVRVKRLRPILHRRQVGGGVEKRAVLLLNEKRRLC